jgi:hypothetical protein
MHRGRSNHLSTMGGCAHNVRLSDQRCPEWHNKRTCGNDACMRRISQAVIWTSSGDPSLASALFGHGEYSLLMLTIQVCITADSRQLRALPPESSHQLPVYRVCREAGASAATDTSSLDSEQRCVARLWPPLLSRAWISVWRHTGPSLLVRGHGIPGHPSHPLE